MLDMVLLDNEEDSAEDATRVLLDNKEDSADATWELLDNKEDSADATWVLLNKEDSNADADADWVLSNKGRKAHLHKFDRQLLRHRPQQEDGAGATDEDSTTLEAPRDEGTDEEASDTPDDAGVALERTLEDVELHTP
ncbi:hypothetical protein BC567DRAFT_259777 [Phyllosticta citribraziliensis]